MRIQNIKNGAQYTDGSFHYSLFFSPQPASATQLPTECICNNTINVTFADCLLAFYLNGNSALPAAAAAAAATTLPAASHFPGKLSGCVQPSCLILPATKVLLQLPHRLVPLKRGLHCAGNPSVYWEPQYRAAKKRYIEL